MLMRPSPSGSAVSAAGPALAVVPKFARRHSSIGVIGAGMFRVRESTIRAWPGAAVFTRRLAVYDPGARPPGANVRFSRSTLGFGVRPALALRLNYDNGLSRTQKLLRT